MNGARLVVLCGLPGVGKSAIAKLLAEAHATSWLRIDSIERSLRTCHLQLGPDLADAGYAAARSVARDNLRPGCTVIADAVHPIEVVRSPWDDMAAEVGATIHWVHVVCTDRTEHRRRVETRAARSGSTAQADGIPTWPEVEARRFDPLDSRPEALILDTAHQSAAAAASEVRAAIDERSS